MTWQAYANFGLMLFTVAFCAMALVELIRSAKRHEREAARFDADMKQAREDAMKALNDARERLRLEREKFFGTDQGFVERECGRCGHDRESHFLSSPENRFPSLSKSGGECYRCPQARRCSGYVQKVAVTRTVETRVVEVEVVGVKRLPGKTN